MKAADEQGMEWEIIRNIYDDEKIDALNRYRRKLGKREVS
jgi:hypothetical protein